MANYVKFMQGTQAQYNKIVNPSPDTLYFIVEADSDKGLLYLGSKLIAGGTNENPVMSIDDLTDVIIKAAQGRDFLVFDANEGSWVNKTAEEMAFIGATNLSNGVGGLVPAPQAGDENKVLSGGGAWISVVTSDQIGSIDSSVTDLNNRLTALEGEVGKEAEGETPASGLFAEIATLKEKDSAIDTSIQEINTALSGKAEQSAVDSLGTELTGLNERLVKAETFLAAAELDGTDTNVIDTLKEIQEYIKSDETGATNMLAAIEKNKEDILALQTATGNNSSALETLNQTVSQNSTSITELSNKFADYTTTEQLNALLAGKAEASVVTELQQAVNDHVSRIGALETGLESANDRIDLTETDIAELKAALTWGSLEDESEA